MTKYPLPIEIVKGRYPIVTQEWGNTTMVDWYKKNGININAHNGTDIVIGGGTHQGQDTYGTKLVCPVDGALLNKVWQLDPMNTQGNGVKVQWQDERGTVKMVVWHCSETNRQAEYQKGDLLGYMGNSGLTSPSPSVFDVYGGSHLHLGTQINNIECDPRDIFDFSKWTISDTDTSQEKDLPPFVYFINKVSQSIKTMLGY